MILADKIRDHLGVIEEDSQMPRGIFLHPGEWRTVLQALDAHPSLLQIVTAARAYREANLPTPLAAAILNAHTILGIKP